MSKPLKYCTNLVRRNAVYYYRRRVPQDLLAQLGKREIWQSLLTKDKTEAIASARALHMLQDEEWAKLRSPEPSSIASPVRLGGPDLAKLANDHIRFLLSRDDVIRQNLMPLLPDLFNEYSVISDSELAKLQQAVARADAGCIERFAKEAEGECPPLVETSKRHLRRALLEAAVVAQSAIVARNKGEIIRSDAVTVPTPSLPPVPSPVAVASSNSLFDAWSGRTRATPKSVGAYRQAFHEFCAFQSKPAASTSRADAQLFVDHLLSASSHTTASKKMGFLTSIFSAAVDREIITTNPFSAIKLPPSKAAAPSRRAYTAQELARVFANPVHKAPGPEAHKYWLPAMAVYTGCRLEELCQLHVSDIQSEGSINFIDINCADGKRVKTQSSIRQIPVHKALISAGFLLYAESRRQAGHVMLFDLKADCKGDLSGHYSKWFGRHLRQTIDIKDKSLVFHSFRHTFKNVRILTIVIKDSGDRDRPVGALRAGG